MAVETLKHIESWVGATAKWSFGAADASNGKRLYPPMQNFKAPGFLEPLMRGYRPTGSSCKVLFLPPHTSFGYGRGYAYQIEMHS